MNILDKKQRKRKRLFEQSMTLVGWLVMFVYIFQIILTIFIWKFNLDNIYRQLLIVDNVEETIQTLKFTGLLFVVLAIVMYAWRRYNFNRYAHLTRRSFSSDVSKEELAEYFYLDPKIVEQMQNDKVITIEKTIV